MITLQRTPGGLIHEVATKNSRQYVVKHNVWHATLWHINNLFTTTLLDRVTRKEVADAMTAMTTPRSISCDIAPASQQLSGDN